VAVAFVIAEITPGQKLDEVEEKGEKNKKRANFMHP